MLVWYKTRFYRANQFAAVYAQFDPRERFLCLSAVKDPFLSQAPNQGLVYQDLVDYVARKIADDDWCHIHARRKPSPTKSAPAGSQRFQVLASGIRESSRLLAWILTAGME